MKKIYSIPQVTIVSITTKHLISQSLGYKDGTVTDESSVLIKEDVSGRSSSGNYNVWNDDWRQ